MRLVDAAADPSSVSRRVWDQFFCQIQIGRLRPLPAESGMVLGPCFSSGTTWLVSLRPTMTGVNGGPIIGSGKPRPRRRKRMVHRHPRTGKILDFFVRALPAVVEVSGSDATGAGGLS